MFDDIGVINDAGRRRRQAESALYTLAIAGLIGSSLGVVGSLGVPLVPVPPPEPPAIDRLWEPEDGTPVALAPAPPRRGEPAGDPGVTPETPVDPVPLPQRVHEPELVRSGTVAQGSKIGVDDGRQNGVPGGTGTSDCGLGDPGCEAGGTGRAAVGITPTFRRRVKPVYPFAERKGDLPDQYCLVRVQVRPDGRPDSVQVRGCPQAFRQEARRAMFRSRWHRFDAPSGAVAAFDLRVQFTLE